MFCSNLKRTKASTVLSPQAAGVTYILYKKLSKPTANTITCIQQKPSNQNLGNGETNLDILDWSNPLQSYEEFKSTGDPETWNKTGKENAGF